jgi:hypothetical protein
MFVINNNSVLWETGNTTVSVNTWKPLLRWYSSSWQIYKQGKERSFVRSISMTIPYSPTSSSDEESALETPESLQKSVFH